MIKNKLNLVRSNIKNFISYARKPQAFKPGDEWHPFEAKRRLFPACLAWPKVMTGMPGT
jgi:hypothetical protein